MDCHSKEYFAKYRVYSVWSAVNANSERFTSELFTPSDSSASLLAPSTLSKNIKCVSPHHRALEAHANANTRSGTSLWHGCRLWKGYFCRWDPTLVPPVPAFQFY